MNRCISYMDKLKDAGYTNVVNESETMYRAHDGKYVVNITYKNVSESFTGSISVYEEK